MAQNAKDIGLDVPAPERACEDRSCPFHGSLKVRGSLLEGQVVSDKMDQTVTVRREYVRKIPKYDRLEKRSSRYAAHVPACLDIRVGDRVLLGECRPLAKTVAFVVLSRQGA